MTDQIDPRPATYPSPVSLEGRDVHLVALDALAHGDALWSGAGGPAHDDLWTYVPDGPFHDRDAFIESLRQKAAHPDRVYWAIVDARDRRALGYTSLMRIDIPNRVVEVGGILYTPALQRTRAGTEAMFLLARHVFEDLGYRRYEWKCNVLNAKSQAAARRLGFTFEGIFRQHMIVKGRSRDSAWFSMLDHEWPARKAELIRWLDPANFDERGRQKTPLRGHGF